MNAAPWEMVIGLETELGIRPLQNEKQSQIEAAMAVVDAYAKDSKYTKPWSYAGEDPLLDMFGNRFGRNEVDSSHLTSPEIPHDFPTTAKGTTSSAVTTNLALASGGRFYVDHAHPEFSTPECEGPLAVTWAHQQLYEVARVALAACGQRYALYQSNVDGKGATWGHHENYRISREVDFTDLASLILGHLVSRQVFCASGRVGLGTSGQVAGFQISARADYIESVSGLQTTYNRPLLNTRDEPHDLPQYRRLHLILGDANNLPYSMYLRVFSTAMVLWAAQEHLRSGGDLSELGLLPADPVRANLEISHDPQLRARVELASGDSLTAIELSRRYLDFVKKYWDAYGSLRRQDGLEKSGDLAAKAIEVENFLGDWEQVLNDLATDPQKAQDRVEWLAKLNLLRRYQERLGCGWDDPRLQALDLRWGELSAQSAAAKLAQAGAFRPLPGVAQITLAPRAHRRAELVRDPSVREIGWRWALLGEGGAARWVDLGTASASEA